VSAKYNASEGDREEYRFQYEGKEKKKKNTTKTTGIGRKKWFERKLKIYNTNTDDSCETSPRIMNEAPKIEHKKQVRNCHVTRRT